MSNPLDRVNWYNLVEAQEAINQWANRKFPMRKPEEALSKLCMEEIPELLLHRRGRGTEDIGPELADCFILLLDLAALWKVHLPSAIYQKLLINEERHFHRDPVTGHYHHQE